MFCMFVHIFLFSFFFLFLFDYQSQENILTKNFRRKLNEKNVLKENKLPVSRNGRKKIMDSITKISRPLLRIRMRKQLNKLSWNNLKVLVLVEFCDTYNKAHTGNLILAFTIQAKCGKGYLRTWGFQCR